MLTKTIGQLDTEVAPSTADYIEIEHSGASGKVTASAMGTLIVNESRPYATTAESLLGTSATAVMSPLQVREAFSANNEAPVYACRAWATFDGTTTSSAISGTYTRLVGTTQTICVATAHGFITGNVAYVDFTTGGASDNSYIVTVTDPDTFIVNTVSTSSVLTSAFTLPRCPINGAGNISSISFNTPSSATYFINFSVEMPNVNYSPLVTAHGNYLASIVSIPSPTQYSFKVISFSDVGTQVFTKISCAVFS